MSSLLRRALKPLLPPILAAAARRLPFARPRSGWSGDYASWEEARARCTGYDHAAIAERVVEATRAVESGRAVFERDSVLFDRIEHSWPLLASLLWIHARRGRLRLIDFGGSLGSSWRQNRTFLGALPGIEWRVLEQPSFVEAGRREFANAPLSFHDTFEGACAGGVDAVLFASSLCYLPDPWPVLDAVRDSGASFLVLDRTPFREDPQDRIAVQTVPPEIYAASYPCRIFSRPKFLARLATDWTAVETWQSDLQPDPASLYLGQLLERRRP